MAFALKSDTAKDLGKRRRLKKPIDHSRATDAALVFKSLISLSLLKGQII